MIQVVKTLLYLTLRFKVAVIRALRLTMCLYVLLIAENMHAMFSNSHMQTDENYYFAFQQHPNLHKPSQQAFHFQKRI